MRASKLKKNEPTYDWYFQSFGMLLGNDNNCFVIDNNFMRDFIVFDAYLASQNIYTAGYIKIQLLANKFKFTQFTHKHGMVSVCLYEAIIRFYEILYNVTNITPSRTYLVFVCK